MGGAPTKKVFNRNSKAFKTKKAYMMNGIKESEKTIAINAALSSYYSAIQTVKDLITAGKTIADIEAFCSAELERKEMMEQGTKNLYLKDQSPISKNN